MTVASLVWVYSQSHGEEVQHTVIIWELSLSIEDETPQISFG